MNWSAGTKAPVLAVVVLIETWTQPGVMVAGITIISSLSETTVNDAVPASAPVGACRATPTVPVKPDPVTVTTVPPAIGPDDGLNPKIDGASEGLVTVMVIGRDVEGEILVVPRYDAVTP